MNKTTILKLNKPEETDVYDLSHQNSNMDTLDKAYTDLKTKETNFKLVPSGWKGTAAPYTQTITFENFNLTDVKGIVTLAPTASTVQRESARNAILSPSSTAANTLTIICDGILPIIELPCVLTSWG